MEFKWVIFRKVKANYNLKHFTYFVFLLFKLYCYSSRFFSFVRMSNELKKKIIFIMPLYLSKECPAFNKLAKSY